jgi:hypothetical protein
MTVIEPVYDGRDEITGYYDLEEYSRTYNDVTHYTVLVSKSAEDNDEIRFSNFYASDISVYAYVNRDRITIPYQIVDGYEIEGVGTIYSDASMDLDYTVRDQYSNAKTDFCDTKARRE